MKLNTQIWKELGALAAKVELIDHESGAVRFKPGTTQAEIDAVNAILALHNPLAEDPQEAADNAATAAAKADNVIQYLVTHTPAECAAYVDANVNNLADAKAFLGKVAMALSVLARREFR